MKKTLNVFGIIAAWILSIALVVMLIVTPIAFSALSLITPKTITEVITSRNIGTVLDELLGQSSAEDVQVTTLSNETSSDDATSALEGMLGDKVTPEQMETILSSQAAKDFIEAYTGDLTSVMIGTQSTSQFNADTIKKIINDNMDEVIEILKTVAPELADKDVEELKSKILETVDQSAQQIVESLPKAESIREQVIDSNPALKTAMDILAKKNTIQWTMVGIIFVLAALIFACRIPGLRGFRWLAIDLFIGAGFAAAVGLVPGTMGSVLGGLVEQASVLALVESLLSAFSKAMLIKAGIMLVVGGLCLTAYILLNKLTGKKTVVAEVAEATEEATVEVAENA